MTQFNSTYFDKGILTLFVVNDRSWFIVDDEKLVAFQHASASGRYDNHFDVAREYILNHGKHWQAYVIDEASLPNNYRTDELVNFIANGNYVGFFADYEPDDVLDMGVDDFVDTSLRPS